MHNQVLGFHILRELYAIDPLLASILDDLTARFHLYYKSKSSKVEHLNVQLQKIRTATQESLKKTTEGYKLRPIKGVEL